jgi:hypothetical protein
LNQSIHLNEALRIRAYQKGRSAAEDETQEPPGHQFHESLSIYLANRFGEVRPSTVVMEHSAWENVDIAVLNLQMETTMPVILWLLGVPLIVVVALMLTHVI